MVSDIVDITGGYNFVTYLDIEGNLYVSGGYAAQITIPKQINSNIYNMKIS